MGDGTLTYEQAKKIAFANTIPNGRVYYAGEAETFYIFIIVPDDLSTDLKNPMFGSTFTAVNKTNGKVWICHVTDPRLKGVVKIE